MFCGGFEAIKAETNENVCEVITYYSRKEWVKYYDFFDSDFENATEFTNSRMISANLNGFGPYSFERPGAGIYSVSYDNFTGKSPLQVYGTGEHEEFYSTFMVTFGSKIRILDMDIGALAAAGGADDADDFVLVDGLRDAAQHVHVAKALLQIDRFNHWPSASFQTRPPPCSARR